MTGARRAGATGLTAVALLAGCTSTPGTAPHLGGTPTSTQATTSAAAPSSTATAPAPVAVTSPAVAQPPSPGELARQAMARLAQRLPAGAISVAVRDETSGDTFAYGARGGMWTGSVYKLLVLETLLLQRQASGDWFSSGELADITAMIEKSDNKAGYRMYLDAGGSAALAATAHLLGMRHTAIGMGDPAFTTMSGPDGLKLLTCLVGDGPLHPQSRAFALSLMRWVQADQRWGAGVLADHGTTFANKNGWMPVRDNNGPGEDDDARWLVNSLGIVRAHGQRLLVSIFTRHNPDFASGVRLVERLARIAAPAVLPPS